MDAVNSSGQRERGAKLLAQARSSGVFTEPSTAAAEVSWRQRYDHLVEANQRLQAKLSELEVAHRKSLTVVKYEPTLPNNDVFTKQLVEENRQLLARYRALELRLFATESKVTSPRRSVERHRAAGSKKPTPRSRAERLPVKTCGVQTDTTTHTEDLRESASSSHSHSQANKRVDAEESLLPHQQPQTVQPEVMALVGELKHRLSDLHIDLDRLRQENELLRSERDELGENDGQQRNTDKWEAIQAQLRTKREQDELVATLRDRVRQMNVLEAQYKHLQENMQAQAHGYRQSRSQVEQLTGELFDAKQTLLKQADALQTRDDQHQQIKMLERELHLVRSENSTLNEAVAALTARPLESLDAQLEKKAIQLAMLEDDKTRLESELQKANQDHHLVVQVNTKLRHRVDELTQQVERFSTEKQALAATLEDCAAAREIAELQLQYHLSGDHDESKQFMEAVGQALAQMKRQKTGGQTTDATAKKCHCGGSEDRVATPSGTAFQQERIEKMAELSKLIQADARAQMQEMRISHQAEVHALARQLRSWKERAREYQQELVVMNQRPSSTKANWKKLPTTVEKASISHSVHGNPHRDAFQETLMEVRIDRLRLELARPHHRKGATRSLLIFCDYFDFEPQNSPVFQVEEGSQSIAPIEMEIGFKLLVDQSFCLSPASEYLTVELHELQKNTSAVRGAALVSMDMLFLSASGNMAMTAKFVDHHNNVTVGSFHLIASLTQPVNRLFTMWKRESKSPALALSRLGLEQSDQPPASLSIRVCCFVLTNSGEREDVSVKYRFMGHPSVRVSTSSKSKAYSFSYFAVDRVKVHDIPQDDSLLKYLEKYHLALAFETSDGREIGSSSVPLKSAAQSIQSRGDSAQILSAAVTVQDDSAVPRPVGKVWVEIEVDTGGIVSISRKTLQPVITRVFGADATGLIDWSVFCQAMTMAASERACREVLVSKCRAKSLSLRTVCEPSDNIRSIEMLKNVFDAADLQLSRSELSLLSGTLSVDTGEFSTDGGSRFTDQLQLIATTSDAMWLGIEATLRRRAHMLNVVVDHASQQHQQDRIDWETFANRLRLI